MTTISIIGSVGKGETDYSAEGAAGSSYTYFPMPGGGYEYDYATFKGVRIDSYPIVVTFQAVDTELLIFYRQIQTPPTPKPIPKDEDIVQTVGASCKIMKHYYSFGTFFYLRHDVNGALTSSDSELRDIQDRIKDYPICNIPVKTPDSIFDELTQKISAGLSSLQKDINNQIAAVTGALSGVTGEISEVKKDIFDIGRFIGSIDEWFAAKFDSMKDVIISWVSDSFIDILEKVLNREVKQ